MSSYVDFVPSFSARGDDAGAIKASEVGNAHLISAALELELPVFREDPIRPASIRDLGRGGSFTVSSGDLKVDIGDEHVFFQGGSYHDLQKSGYGDKQPPKFKTGDTVAIKSTNLVMEGVDVDIDGDADAWPDLSTLVTEISILSHSVIRGERSFPRLLGIGWHKVPGETTSIHRHAPYLITEFGKRGNLADYLRYYHRKSTNMTQLVKFSPSSIKVPSTVNRDLDLPWQMKIIICIQISEALQLLHHFGVVHGDVKMDNVIASSEASDTPGQEEIGFKICDFGSSVLMMDSVVMDNDDKVYRLKSKTVPWDAPEAGQLLTAAEMIKTDVYSFGMLFARIMLNGHDPFDSTFHLAIDATPKRDKTLINRLKRQDELGDHIMSRIRKIKSYSQNQLEMIRNVLSCTVRRDAENRVYCLHKISAMLSQQSNGPVDLAACENCFTWSNPTMHGFCVTRPKKLIPKIQLHQIHSLYPVMREFVIDLFSISNRTNAAQRAESCSLLAHCHLNGLGTSFDPREALQWLRKAVLAGDEPSLKLFGILALAYADEPTQVLGPHLLGVLRSTYPESNHLIVSRILSTLDPNGYRRGMELTRSGRIDLVGDARYSLVESPSDAVDSQPTDQFEVRPFDGNLSLPRWFGIVSLHRACIEGRLGDVEEMLSRPDCHVNQATRGGHTPLWMASNCGHAEVCKRLVEAGASAAPTDVMHKLSPMHFLCRFDEADIPYMAQLLKNAGASPHAISKARETPLMFIFNMARNFRIETRAAAARALLELGASPFGATGARPDPAMSETPLRAAAVTMNPDLFLPIYSIACKRFVQYITILQQDHLKRALAVVGMRLQLDIRLFLWAVKSPIIMRATENGKDQRQNVVESLKYLLSPAVRFVLLVLLGEPALALSIRSHSFDIATAILTENLLSADELRHYSILESVIATHSLSLLLDCISAGLNYAMVNSWGQNMLHLVVEHGWTREAMIKVGNAAAGSHLDFLKLVQQVDVTGSSPFDMAVLGCNFALADWMYSLGVLDIDSWHFKAGYGHFDLSMTLLGRCLYSDGEREKLLQVRYLLGWNARLLVSKELGDTALTMGFQPWRQKRKRVVNPEQQEVFNTDVLELLLDHFSKMEQINQGNYQGSSPLHYAASTGNLPAVKLLLERGADVNALDNGDSTPLESAGDSLYNIHKDSTSGYLYAETHGSITETTIEYYVVMEVYRYLESMGGKPGSEIENKPQRKLSPEAEAAERMYSMVLDANIKGPPPVSKTEKTAATGIMPPPERRDLGVMPGGFTVHPNKEYFESPMRRFQRAIWGALKPEGEEHRVSNDAVTREAIREGLADKERKKRVTEVLIEMMPSAKDTFEAEGMDAVLMKIVETALGLASPP